MSQRTEDGSSRPTESSRSSAHSGPSPEHPFDPPPNAFSRELFAVLRNRDHHPATPEADFAGPWQVKRLYGAARPGDESADGVRWGCFAAGDREPTLHYPEPDQAFLGAAGLALAERPPRFRFQDGGDGRLHLVHDGYPVGTVAPSMPEGCSLPADLTNLANLRTQPQALAHFLMAVPEEVLEKAGVLVMRMLEEVER